MDFNINYKNFVKALFPWFLRKTKNLDFINSAVKGLQTLNDSLFAFRNEIVFKLAFNGQIIYLEKYLNTVYPNPYTSPNDINIIDGANIEYDYIFNYSELQDPNYFFNFSEGEAPVYFNNFSEFVAGTFSFTVKVPTYVQTANDYNGVAFNENLLIKRINTYKIAGKNYNIVYF